MKRAIVADWLTTYAGAEKCIESFTNLYPDSDVFSLVDFLNEKERNIILKGKYAKTSFIQNLPFKEKFRNYLPLFPYAVENFDLREYDLILSSSHSVAKNVLTHSEQLHICYCHTPMRYAWDMFLDYTNNLSFPKRQIVKYFLHKIRIWDYVGAGRVDYFIANSKFIQKRIKKVYKRDSVVIYPPVDVDKFTLCTKKEDYYVTMSRLVGYKRVDLIVKAFNKNGKKLIVIGDGEEFENIKKIAKSNIELMGYLKEDEAIKIIQKAKAFVFAAIEDFGITPVEAQACGTPVIALNKGGSAESVNEKTGVFFEIQSINSINKAIKEFESKKFDYNYIRKWAERFSRDRFEREIKEFVGKVMDEKSI